MTINRRSFLKHLGIGSAASLALTSPLGLHDILARAEAASRDQSDSSPRLRKAKKVRDKAAALAFRRGLAKQKSNGEEKDYPYLATYSKGLPHNDLGEVDQRAMKSLLKAIDSESQRKFESVLIADKRLKNPMAGFAFDLMGKDPQQFSIPPAPRIDSAENSAEMGELYWQSLCRDINFKDYGGNTLVAEACTDLSRFTGYKGPQVNGTVTPATIFRGASQTDLVGPYISQFLFAAIPVGVRSLPGQSSSLTLEQRHHTFLANSDFLTSYQFWLHRLNGGLDGNTPQYDSTNRYIRNGRDLAAAVQIDIPFQWAMNAAYILLGLGMPYDPGNPYRTSATMDGFATLGYPHVLSLVAEVGIRALRAVWFHKWSVHRRFRPESFGGHIHNHLIGAANYPMIDGEIFGSSVLSKVFDYNKALDVDFSQGTYLLPQTYPEGSPLHPAYASGHATAIGACVTVLKAFFDDSFTFPNPVIPNDDGTVLEPYLGADASLMTIAGELNKLASNVAIGRNWAGIHWRSDAVEGLKLGEAVAIEILKEQSITCPEKHSFQFTDLSGKLRRIR